MTSRLGGAPGRASTQRRERRLTPEVRALRRRPALFCGSQPAAHEALRRRIDGLLRLFLLLLRLLLPRPVEGLLGLLPLHPLLHALVLHRLHQLIRRAQLRYALATSNDGLLLLLLVDPPIVLLHDFFAGGQIGRRSGAGLTRAIEESAWPPAVAAAVAGGSCGGWQRPSPCQDAAPRDPSRTAGTPRGAMAMQFCGLTSKVCAPRRHRYPC